MIWTEKFFWQSRQRVSSSSFIEYTEYWHLSLSSQAKLHPLCFKPFSFMLLVCRLNWSIQSRIYLPLSLVLFSLGGRQVVDFILREGLGHNLRDYGLARNGQGAEQAKPTCHHKLQLISEQSIHVPCSRFTREQDVKVLNIGVIVNFPKLHAVFVLPPCRAVFQYSLSPQKKVRDGSNFNCGIGDVVSKTEGQRGSVVRFRWESRDKNTIWSRLLDSNFNSGRR